MRIANTMLTISWFLLFATIMIGPICVRSDPHPLNSPIMPKVFLNVDELKEYLDLVKDAFNVNTKSRYGKRAGNQAFPDPIKHVGKSLRLKLKLLNQVFRGIVVE